MKIIEVTQKSPSLDQVMEIADHELVLFRKQNGMVFALSEIDEFALETTLLKNNPEFRAFLAELSRERDTFSLQALRQDLGL